MASRFTVLPLFALAVWSRVWIGWWAVLVVALVCVWAWWNPRAFPPPSSTDTWAAKGTFGERVFLNRKALPIPDHHFDVVTAGWAIGHLTDPAYLAAIGLGTVIFNFIFWAFGFLRMGTTGIAAQRYGADDYDGLRVSLGQALIVAQMIALVLLLLQAPLGHIALQLIGAEPDVEAFALEYFSIRIWSAPGTLANYALIGWFLGLQNARVPLLIFLTINVTNIVLDLVFVLGFGMKVDGVALASVIAEYTALLVAVAFAARELKRRAGHWPLARLLRVRAYGAFFSVNANLFVRTLALMFTFFFITAQGARLGGLVLAANAVLMNFVNLTSFALDGFAHAAEALVGKAVGQRNRRSLEESVRLCLKWSLYFAAGISGAYLVTGQFLVEAVVLSILGGLIGIAVGAANFEGTRRVDVPGRIVAEPAIGQNVGDDLLHIGLELFLSDRATQGPLNEFHGTAADPFQIVVHSMLCHAVALKQAVGCSGNVLYGVDQCPVQVENDSFNLHCTV